MIMKKTWAQQYIIELIILPILLLIVTASFYMQSQTEFIDTDDCMRLVRIRDFFNHYDLSDNIIKRCNVPYGCSLHWTRFYDFFLIIPSYILSFFTGSIDKAIYYVGFCITPIIRIVTTVVFLKVMQNLMRRDDAFLCAVLFVVHPIMTVNGNFGRPDHHAFIMLFIILFLGCIFEAIKSNFKKHYLSTARLTTLCIWISPETLIPLLIVDGVLFLYAFKQKECRKKHNIFHFLCLKNLEVACNIGLLLLISSPSLHNSDCYTYGMVTIVVSLYIARIFLKNRRSSDFFLLLYLPIIMNLPNIPVYYDEISAVHWGLYTSIAYFFYIFAYKPEKPINFIFAIAIGLVFLGVYPKFLQGMEADITPYVKEIWLKKISEMQSPFTSGDHVLYIFHAVFVLVAIFNKSRELLIEKYKNEQHKTILWIVIISCSFVYLILAGLANRMLFFSSLFSLPLLLDLGMNSVYVEKINKWGRITITLFITLLFIFITDVNDREDENNAEITKNEYTTRELFAEIDKLSSTPVVIMAHSNDGPNILYYTKHCAVGAPYHRQQEGIISSYKVMEAIYDEDEIKKELIKTNASYILILKSPARYNINANKKAKNLKQSLPDMIISEKNYPNWISIVKLPKKFKDVIVAKIDKEKIRD